MTNGDDSLTHKDLAKALGVSETTIKSYRRKFPLFFPLQSHGKPLRFKPATLDVCRDIRQGFLKDLSTEEIRHSLEKQYQHIKQSNHKSKAIDIAGTPPPSTTPELAQGLLSLSQGLDALLRAQQDTNRGLNALQETLADFLSLHLTREDAFSRGLEELKNTWQQHLQSLAAHPPPTEQQPRPLSGPKRVTVRNVYGESNEYLIESSPAPTAAPVSPTPTFPQAHADEPSAPSETFLDLPLVVQTGAREFLGVAGKSEGAFSLRDLIGLVQRAYAPPRHFSSVWRAVPDVAGRWRLHLEQEDAIRPLVYDLEMESVQTPKGNDVALLSRFEVQGAEMPPPNLYAFIRQMKELLA